MRFCIAKQMKFGSLFLVVFMVWIEVFSCLKRTDILISPKFVAAAAAVLVDVGADDDLHARNFSVNSLERHD